MGQDGELRGDVFQKGIFQRRSASVDSPYRGGGDAVVRGELQRAGVHLLKDISEPLLRRAEHRCREACGAGRVGHDQIDKRQQHSEKEEPKKEN